MGGRAGREIRKKKKKLFTYHTTIDASLSSALHISTKTINAMIIRYFLRV